MRRFAWFDCLRCAAIFLVMCAHSPDVWKQMSASVGSLFLFLQLFGWAGVDLFFVLSGFLVSGLLFNEHDATGTLNIKRFLVRRAFKIIPAFYVLVIITAIRDAIAIHEFKPDHIFHDITFIQGYRMGSWTHAWTLAVEVHFYILLALLLYYLSKRPAKNGQWLARLPAILCWVLVIELAARLVNSWIRSGNFNVHKEFMPTHLHLDVLAAGVLLRYLYTYHFDRLAFLTRFKLPALIVGILVSLPSVYLWPKLWPLHSDLMTALIPTMNSLGFGLILFVATQIPFPATGVAHWLVKPFDYFGKHSYSIYLWHLPVKEWIVDPLLPKPAGILYFVVFVSASMAVGSFFSEILEMPILRLRNRLFPSKAIPTDAPSSPAATVTV